MAAVFVLDWAFTPTDMFEEQVTFDVGECSFVLNTGSAQARLSAEGVAEDQIGTLRGELHEALDARFLAAQVLGHRQYLLSKPSMVREHDDGRRDGYMFPEPASLKFTCAKVDFITTDADGNVQDSKRNRIAQRKSFAVQAAKYITDPIVNSIVRSYSAAVSDPRNELIHLYEIRDAMLKRFGGEKTAQEAIGISSTQWSRLGRLANEEPITQGRHRGKQSGLLREATEVELEEARSIARAMIQGFLHYLDRGAKP